MKPQLNPSFITTIILLLSATSSTATPAAYPSPYGEESCGLSGAEFPIGPERRDDDTYGNGRIIDITKKVKDTPSIIDITHRINPNMPAFESSDGVGQFLKSLWSMKNGSVANTSEMKLHSHTGTHVDSPGHFYDEYLDAGFDIDSLDLHVLNGT